MEPRVIKIKAVVDDVDIYREFRCYGGKNPNKCCVFCKLRFSCFSSLDELIIDIKEFGVTIEKVDALAISKTFMTSASVYTKDNGKSILMVGG